MSTRALQFDILLLGFRDPDTDAPLAFGVVNFLSAGTSDKLTVWDTKEKTGAKTSVTLDVNGQAQVYGDGVYKLEVLDADAVAVSYSPMDNIKIRAVSTNVVETNTTYTATTDDDLILCDTSAGAVLINLYPAADFIAGLTIKNISLAGNNVTVDPSGAELIDGQSTQDLVDGQANEFFSNGTGWFGNGVSTGTNFTSTSLLFGDGLQEDTVAGVTTIDVVDVHSTDGTEVLDGGTDGNDAIFTGSLVVKAMTASAWPSFSAYLSGNQTNITGSDKILFTTEVFDTNNNFASGRFTPTVAGKYLLSCGASWTSITAGDTLLIRIKKNGSEYRTVQDDANTTTGQSQVVTDVVDANGTTDYFEVFAENTDRDTSDIAGGAPRTFFAGSRIA